MLLPLSFLDAVQKWRPMHNAAPSLSSMREKPLASTSRSPCSDLTSASRSACSYTTVRSLAFPFRPIELSAAKRTARQLSSLSFGNKKGQQSCEFLTVCSTQPSCCVHCYSPGWINYQRTFIHGL